MYLAGSSNGYFDPIFARRSETILKYIDNLLHDK